MTNAHISRRTLLALSAAATFATPRAVFAKTAAPTTLEELERAVKGRLGVHVINTANGQTLSHRAGERFAMCSTFKMPLAAAIMKAAAEGKLSLDTMIKFSKADLVPNAPISEENVAKGEMSIRTMAEAAQKQSDNTAANLLLKQIGGPAGFTQFFRSIGDDKSRLDRYEPHMNDVKVNDERDTTTPLAAATTTQKILLGDVIPKASRDLLTEWMIATETGKKRLRAGLPADWKAGDKTGTGMIGKNGKFNDVAIIWPPGKAPLIVASYYNTEEASDETYDKHQAVLADAGRIIAAWAAKN